MARIVLLNALTSPETMPKPRGDGKVKLIASVLKKLEDEFESTILRARILQQ